MLPLLHFDTHMHKNMPIKQAPSRNTTIQCCSLVSRLSSEESTAWLVLHIVRWRTGPLNCPSNTNIQVTLYTITSMTSRPGRWGYDGLRS